MGGVLDYSGPNWDGPRLHGVGGWAILWENWDRLGYIWRHWMSTSIAWRNLES